MPPLQPRIFVLPDLGHIVRAIRPAPERNPAWAAEGRDTGAGRSQGSRVVMYW